MKRDILIISIFLICLIDPSVLVIAQNSNQTQKPSAIDNAMTELKARIEQKKKELKDKGIDINSITPREIEELLDSNALTIDDVENMFPEEKLMKLRVSTVLRADKDNKEAFVIPLVIGESLYELRYYVGELPSGKMTPKLKDAIKDFQQSLGNNPTGELLFGEFIELAERSDKLHPKRISLPKYSFFKYSDYVRLSGTWVFKDGTPQGIPIQTSVIELNKNTMSGVEAGASIFEGFEGNGSLFIADIIHWKITKWNTEEIVAENDAPKMVSYTMTVDLEGEKVYMYRRPKGEKIIEDLELKPSILELVDGFKVSWDLHQKRQKEARKLYNPKYQNAIEQLSQTTTKHLPASSKGDLIRGTLAKQKAASSNKTSTEGAKTIFIGFPKKKVSEGGLDRVVEDLSRKKAVNLRCVISKIEDKYYWASRENVEMIKIERAGAFITFLAVNGSGYVRVIKPELKEAASLMSKTEESFDYVEYLTIGLRSVNYWGEKER